MTKRTDAIAAKKNKATRQSHPYHRQQPARAARNQNAPAANSAAPRARQAAQVPFPYPDMLQPTRSVGKRSFVVVGQPTIPALQILTTVLYMTQYYCELVHGLFEARRAQREGGQHFVNKFPGKSWPVQAFYEEEKRRNAWKVLFEGWDCSSIITTRKMNTEEAETCAMRATFLESLENVFLPTKRTWIRNARYLCSEYRDDAKHIFWQYEDLAFYHSAIQSEQEMAKVFYFCFSPRMVAPPIFHYSALNVVEAEALEYCYQQEANKSYAELNDRRQWVPKTNNGVCENSLYCKCNARFEKLYASRNTKNLQPRQDGTLDMNGVKRDDYKIVMECTDECGCSQNCPRRQLQKGQTKALAVVHENKDKGFGLRAVERIKSGELICEYAGYIYCPEHKTQKFNEKKDTSYEATFEVMNEKKVVIDSIHIGNVSRFANHKCKPNSMFIEVESRKSVSEPLIPRIALYATEDIEIGEEVTVAYFDVGVINATGTMKCKCGCTPCIKHFPTL